MRVKQKIRLAINGFGRIGRNVLRSAMARSDYGRDFEIVVVNDLMDVKTLSYLLKYDSIFGVSKSNIEAKESSIVVDGKEIKILAERDPE